MLRSHQSFHDLIQQMKRPPTLLNAYITLNGQLLFQGNLEEMHDVFSRLTGDWFHDSKNRRSCLTELWGSAGHRAYLEEIGETVGLRMRGELQLTSSDQTIAEFRL